jgi:hypothetical protein
MTEDLVIYTAPGIVNTLVTAFAVTVIMGLSGRCRAF